MFYLLGLGVCHCFCTPGLLPAFVLSLVTFQAILLHTLKLTWMSNDYSKQFMERFQAVWSVPPHNWLTNLYTKYTQSRDALPIVRTGAEESAVWYGNIIME